MRYLGAALALAMLSLAGCAEDVPTVRWAKPGAGSDAFAQDREACATYARAQQQPFYLGGARYAGRPDALDSGLFFSCMTERGWHRDPNGFAAPPGETSPLSP
ncbi:MAG: hypothetical protein ACREHF_03670 [Rhizomicrobium sp.]